MSGVGWRSSVFLDTLRIAWHLEFLAVLLGYRLSVAAPAFLKAPDSVICFGSCMIIFCVRYVVT